MPMVSYEDVRFTLQGSYSYGKCKGVIKFNIMIELDKIYYHLKSHMMSDTYQNKNEE